MTPEQLADEIAYAVDNPRTVNMPALLELGYYAVSLLRMIDARREAGVKFDASYNEDMLRRVLAPLADQKFPPGPPMKPPSPVDARGEKLGGEKG